MRFYHAAWPDSTTIFGHPAIPAFDGITGLVGDRVLKFDRDEWLFEASTGMSAIVSAELHE